MEKYFLLSLFLVNYSLLSQWFPIPDVSTQDMNGIYFIDTDTGCVVGNAGLILRSTNGGRSWSVIQSPVTYSLNKVVFKSPLTGYACGNNGYILKTTNGGLNWFILLTGTTLTFRDIAFTDVNTGMAVGAGGLIRTTTNGGANWTAATISPPWGLTGISMVNINRIYVSGTDLPGAAIFLSTDFGMSWTQVYLLSNIGLTESYALDEVFFVNDSTGFAVGSSVLNNQNFGNIYMTTNGGTNWSSSYTISSATSSFISDIYFSSASTGTAVGSSGIVLRTTSSGSNWDLQTSSTNHDLYSVYFLDDNTGFASGFAGALIKTTNGGYPIGIKPITNEVPKTFILYQNYPNPFNPTTKIKFDIPASPVPSKGGGLNVRLEIYDILGKQVASLIPPLGGGQEGLQPGSYEVEWNASGYASGVYFYQLRSNDFVETKKMVLMR